MLYLLHCLFLYKIKSETFATSKLRIKKVNPFSFVNVEVTNFASERDVRTFSNEMKFLSCKSKFEALLPLKDELQALFLSNL